MNLFRDFMRVAAIVGPRLEAIAPHAFADAAFDADAGEAGRGLARSGGEDVRSPSRIAELLGLLRVENAAASDAVVGSCGDANGVGQDFTEVGPGRCLDSVGQYYNYAESVDTENCGETETDCLNYCYSLPSPDNAPGGDGGERPNRRGFEWLQQSQGCRCLYDADTTESGAWLWHAWIHFTREFQNDGKGEITTSSGDEDAVCFTFDEVSRGPTITPPCDGNYPGDQASCCTSKTKCGDGEGDCDNDDQCNPGLRCGKNNCRANHPKKWGADTPEHYDCCYDPVEWPCDATNLSDRSSCCTSAYPCGEGEGDCDNDRECNPGFRCGVDNCGAGSPEHYDCCTAAKKYKCDDTNPYSTSNCCTSVNPCGVGEGDCDNDDECGNEMKCGTDNCVSDFNWDQSTPSGHDCCYQVKKTGWDTPPGARDRT